jgi:hypothetical protein
MTNTSLRDAIARAWNWKAAVLSASGRSLLFLLANLGAGIDAALAAATTEFMYRVVAAGFYGGLTERFARLRPTPGSTAVAIVVVAGIAHTIEFVVHSYAGTAMVGRSVLISILVSVLTTRVNLFAMRRGLLAVDGFATSLTSDLKALAGLARTSVASAIEARGWRRSRTSA